VDPTVLPGTDRSPLPIRVRDGGAAVARRFVGSVRVRLTVAVTLIFAVTLSAAAYILVHQVQATLIEDVRSRNDTVAQAVSRLLSNGSVSVESLRANSFEVPQDVASAYDQQMLNEGITQSYIFVQGSGLNTADSSPTLFERLRSFLGADTSTPQPLFGKTVPSALPPDRFAVSTLTINTRTGPVLLSVASPLDSINRTVSRLKAALFFAVPGLILAVGLMTWFMTGRVLRPVTAITGRVNEITGSTLDERVPVPPTDDEIAELAQTMNAMLDRLESSADRQRRFMSDASHELRSPVASIRLQLETALMDPSTDWPAVAQTVLGEDARLESLVSNLLALTRLEEGVRRPHVEVDLDEIVLEQTRRPFRVPVDRRGVGAGRVMGVPTELASVVRNLVDNAARHAATEVRVMLGATGGVVRLTVIDDGPGVPVDMREKVFERFARLSEARTRDAGGAGLGLALTKRIVEAHGGTIHIEDAPLQGASFVVELPAAPGDANDLEDAEDVEDVEDVGHRDVADRPADAVETAG